MQDAERISPTGYYTSYAWHALGFPYADLFATRRGRALFHAFRLLQGPETFAGQEPVLLRTLRNRHEVIDGALRSHGPDHVVELAAGLSPRGVEWSLDRHTRYTELDLPGMVALKRRLLAERGDPSVRGVLAERLTLRAQDLLAPGFEEVLRSTLAGTVRPAIVAEGLLTHLHDGDRRALLETIATVLRDHPSGIFLSDVRVQSAETARAMSTLTLGIRLVTGGRQASRGMASHGDAQALLRAAGFDEVVQLPSVDRREPPLLAGVWLARSR